VQQGEYNARAACNLTESDNFYREDKYCQGAAAVRLSLALSEKNDVFLGPFLLLLLHSFFCLFFASFFSPPVRTVWKTRKETWLIIALRPQKP